MRFSLGGRTAILAALAAPALADYVYVFEYCDVFACTRQGVWYNAYGQSWNFDANDGCRPPYVTSVREVCMDYNAQRAHFITDWGERRCMVMTSHEWKDCDRGLGISCVDMIFQETPCTWG